MREPISLKEILAVVVKRGRGILLTALAVAIVLGAYQGKKQLDLSKLPENAPQQIEDEYKEALEAYDEQKTSLQEDLEEAEFALERQIDYIENSVYMKLDPYHLNKGVRVLSFELLGGSGLEELPDQSEDRYDRMLNKLQSDYRAFWNAGDLIQELKAYGIPDMEEKYLRELIALEVTGGTITVNVFGETAADVQKMLNGVCNWLMDLSVSNHPGVYPHKLSVLTGATKTIIFEGMQQYQQDHLDRQKAYEEEVADLESQLEDLPVPERRAGYSKQAMLKAAIKWAILGIAAGIILSCGWILVMFMFRTRVESSRQMESVLGVPFLGSAAGIGNIWERLAARILKERVWQDPAQAEAYMTEAFRAVAEAPELVVMLTSLTGKKIDLSMVEKAAAATAGKVICITEAEKNPETVKALQNADCVLLAERVGVSEVPEMLSLMEQAKRAETKVVGFVTI